MCLIQYELYEKRVKQLTIKAESLVGSRAIICFLQFQTIYRF